MPVTRSNQILDEIKTLETDELREVERTVRQLLTTPEKEDEREAVRRVLYEAGLVKDIKRPPVTVDRERPLIYIQGKPLSETIIEERI